MARSKYDLLKRSQLMTRLIHLERAIMHTKVGSERDRTLRAERQEIFEAIRRKDDELLERWKRNGYYNAR